MNRLRVTHLVDSGPQVGLGHLRRQLVLAEALAARGAICRFGLSDPEVGIELPNCVAETFTWDRRELPQGDVDALVVDSYQVDPELLASSRSLIVAMDDLAERPLAADLVVNHNAYGDLCDYGAYRAGRLLAGPRFAMVGAAFRALREHPADGLLVNFGATDDGRLSLPLIAALRDFLPEVPILVALMRVAPEQQAALERLRAEVRLARPLEEAMAEARVFVGAAGVSLLEALAAGRMPVVCAIADNQRINIEFLSKRGLPAFPRPDPQAMAQAVLECYATSVVVAVPELDGLGAERVADAIGAAVQERCATPGETSHA
ncbi:MAG: hypothetical protein ACTS10_14695 [Kiloniellales bacterium]